MDSALIINYKEKKLPNAKYIAASWLQLKVYSYPDMILALGDPHILDHMCTEIRNHAQRHKQDILTQCFNWIDPHTAQYYFKPETPTVEAKDTSVVTEGKTP